MKIFTTKGRLNRLKYFKYSMLLLLLTVIFAGIAIVSFQSDSFAFLIVALVCMLLCAVNYVGAIFLSVRRLHDLNLSGWWYALICLVSIVSGFLQEIENETMQLAALGLNFVVMAFSMYLFVKKGTDGDNDYGEDLLKS